MREVLQLHTLEQWFAQPQQVRSTVLQNIKLVQRLKSWTETKAARPSLTEPKWVPCNECGEEINGARYPGWKLKSPRAPGIHPSQLGNACMLKIYWDMEGKPAKRRFDFQSHMIFELGTAAHKMLQSYGLAGAWGPHYRPETVIAPHIQPLADELYMYGSADADSLLVIDDIPDFPVVELGLIHEYKTIKSENFTRLTAPKPEHRQQATIYMRLLNRPVMVVLYFNKNDSNMTEYPVAFDPSLWNIIEAKARRLVQFYQDEQPPPANIGFGCRDCDYAYDCSAYADSKKG